MGIRNNTKIKIIIDSLKQFQGNTKNKASTRRSSRRNRNQQIKQKLASNSTKMAVKLLKLFENGEDVQVEQADFDMDAVSDFSLGYLSSYLLVKIIKHSIHSLNVKRADTNVKADNDEQKSNSEQQSVYCQQIMDYMCHPAVIYKLACIVQMDCIKLETQQNGQMLAFDIYPYIENEFVLLELVTRNMSTIKTKQKEKSTDGMSDKQTEKEALLKILDCVGLGLRFTEYTFVKNLKRCKVHSPMMIDEEVEDDDVDVDMTEGDNAFDSETIQRLLTLILKVLTNVTNGRSVSLKEQTLNSIFFLLAYYDDIVDSIVALLKQKESASAHGNYEMICLILGCLINCCEKNKKFRNSFGEKKIDGIGAIDFLIGCFDKSRKVIGQIKVRKENENDSGDGDEEDNILYNAYLEYQVISYYVALLLGFLLQNTENFKYIASKMGDLSMLIIALNEFLSFQTHKKMQNASSQRTMTIIAKIIEIAAIRNKQLRGMKKNNDSKQ